MSFVHLHSHTEYSLLDGSNKVSEYVARVKELGMDAAAITDHGVMYGVVKFYRAALEAGIKPILGCEVYVAPGSRFDKEASHGEDRYHHLVLLAENNLGYSNLIKIVSAGFTEGYYYKPRVDKELLRQRHEGIIALSACLAGEVPRAILADRYDEARRIALEYRDIFGEGNYFLELQDHGMREQRKVNTELLRMSKDYGIGLVATNDIHYTYAGDADAHDLLLCLQTGKKVADKDRMRYEGGQYYVKSEDEMRLLFQYAPEAIDNTERIAERCNVTLEFGKMKLPAFEVPEGYDTWSYLNHLCDEGMKHRYADENAPADETGQTLRQRMDYELGVIQEMGFVEYFLIVWDYVNYAKKSGIPVGPGRGSAAGSIVSYCLGITDVDPIRYGLLFERFLNPERVSMPDIDMDFDPERRGEVIDYVARKYGSDRVVQIITFGTLAAKGVLKDVARVMDLPYAFGDNLSRMIPNELNITLDRALEVNPDFRKLCEEDEQVRTVVEMAKRLEGLPRHASIHAAGVIICPEPASEYVPLALGSEGEVITQFEAPTMEELGLLKMDFLGLRNLTVIRDAVELAEQTTGERIDFERLGVDDPEVYALISTGRTDGIFQLESSGMKNFMKELRPQCFEDVVAGISLYRPGPMDFIPKYIAGKENRDSVVYDTPQLEPILSETYGCMVYQEQVMQIVRDLGGYSMGRSDLVRRAMAKKKAHVMEVERDIFINGNARELAEAQERIEAGRAAGEPEGKLPVLPQAVPGCKANGISEQVANKIYDEMMDFANYAFNKSHAVSYAVVSYQTAYLKCHYPVEFMAALLTSVINNRRKLPEYLLICKEMGIEVLPPDINIGQSVFSVADGKIRYALTAIKSVGWPVIEAVVADRERSGPFRSMRDFIERVAGREVNKRAIEGFIKAGAFDSLGGTRKGYMEAFGSILDDVMRRRKERLSGQISLFDLLEDQEKAGTEGMFGEQEIDLDPADTHGTEEYEKGQLLAMEREVLGIYVSGHPLEEDEELMKSVATATAADFVRDEETGAVLIAEGSEVVLGGMIAEKTPKYTKKGDVMCFLTLEDLVGSTEVIVFPRQYEKYGSGLLEDDKVFVRGHAQVEEDKDGKLIADEIVTFDQASARGQNVWERVRRGTWGDPGIFGGARGGSEGGYAGNSRAPQSGRRAPSFAGDFSQYMNPPVATVPKTGLFLQFADESAYCEAEERMLELLADSDGNDDVVIFVRETKRIKILPPNRRVRANAELRERLAAVYGEENVKVR